MYLNFFSKFHFITLLRHLSILFIVFSATKSTGENSGISFDSYTPRYEKKAWYVIELGNVPIGTAIVSIGKGKDKKNIPSDYALQIVSRVGSSPITSENFVHMRETEVEQKFLSKAQNGTLAEDAVTFLTKKKNFFY